MKVSTINARVDKAGVHNDRSFDTSTSPHIDPTLSCENKYYIYNNDYSLTFFEAELEFYNNTFADYLNERNARNIASKHPGRVIGMEKYLKGTITKPEDRILQIGDRDEYPNPDVLWQCALEYKEQFEKLYGDNCKILDMAMHVDEPNGTPHVHVRRVWIHTDDNGNKVVGQEKALLELGILPPDTTAAVGKNNNAKMTFTREDRNLFANICKEHDLQISMEHPENREHLPKLEYIKQQVKKEITNMNEELENLRLERTKLSSEIKKGQDKIDSLDEILDSQDRNISLLENLYRSILENQIFMDRYKKRLDTIKKEQDALKRLYALNYICTNEAIPYLESVVSVDDIQLGKLKASYNAQLKIAERFIDKNGLSESYHSEKNLYSQNRGRG